MAAGGRLAQRVTTPSWVINFSRFATPQCSVILPLTTRMMSTVSNPTGRYKGLRNSTFTRARRLDLVRQAGRRCGAR
jgi:hypothetical protein